MTAGLAPTAPAPPAPVAAPAPTPPAPPAPVAAPAPTAIATIESPSSVEIITCPECGTSAQVTLNRRDSVDFCRTCDYPLFWTPSKVMRDPASITDESLRRLPGTVGRATLAALPCPWCSEPNGLSAVTCVRCGRPMHRLAEAPPPPPPPTYVAPPPPAPEPKQKVAWWVWVLLALGAAALITLVVLIATHTIG
jgi:hypothetical protein